MEMIVINALALLDYLYHMRKRENVFKKEES